MILVTTSDYFPQLGGLSTFTENIVQSLRSIGEEVEIFHWKKTSDIQSFNFDNLKKYKLVINVHVMFCWLAPVGQERMINFVHGSEILMTSPNLLKKVYKQFKKKSFFEKTSHSYINFFISNATLKKIKQAGYQSNVATDIVFHNCIDVNNANLIDLSLDSEVVFTCIVRNVPHKNLDGAVAFCERYSHETQRKVKLVIPHGIRKNSTIVEIENLKDQSDLTREAAYQKANYNLLLSFDHSKFGFFEGFGLTVLEAAKYGCPSIVNNTGGLPESTHHLSTGFVINVDEEDQYQMIFKYQNNDYKQMRKNAFNHTVETHGLDQYSIFFKKVLHSLNENLEKSL